MSTSRWVLAAALLGLASSTLLSSVLRLPRDLFIGLHAAAVVAFIAAYLRSRRIDPMVQLRRRWLAGVLGGAIVGAAVIRTVLNQPGSSRPAGAGLAWALAWDGGVYGLIDALLLSVLPVLALYGARPAEELRHPTARWRWGLTALAASGAITAAYHAGFTEYRGAGLIAPLIGNTLITVSYLATGSPVAPIVSHILMHGAAVLHGMATTVQLPPHY